MPSPARLAAFRTLRALSSPRADLGEALTRARDPLPDARDRALTTDLVLGTLRWRGALDYQLELRSRRPLDRLDDAVLDALRLGTYQLLHQRRVPASAVVNDAVSLVKSSGVSSAAGFANALLRRVARERDVLTWPARPADASSPEQRLALAAYLAVVHSHPRWLVERWIDRVGVEDTERWLRFNNVPPAITIAANRLRGNRESLRTQLAQEDIRAEPTVHASHGLTVTEGRVLSSFAYRDGACLVQDEAAQLIAEIVDAADGDRVLDACAAPGGKSLALAAQCAPSGLVIATDVRARRVRLLVSTLQRCRVTRVHVVQIPSAAALPFRAETFDRVLVDAPCSGLGTLRRDPDIRWRRRPEDLARLAAAQRDLCARVAPLVAAGGRLIYSTCSSEPEENEEIVSTFVADTREFQVMPVSQISEASDSIRAMQTADGYLRTDPTHGLEAFFGAILAKRL